MVAARDELADAEVTTLLRTSHVRGKAIHYWRRSRRRGYYCPAAGPLALMVEESMRTATSELLRDSNDDGATTKVGLAASEPNEVRRRAQREDGTSAVRTGRYGQTRGSRRKARLRRVPMRVRDLSHIDGTIRWT